jgi:hypothetical protein
MPAILPVFVLLLTPVIMLIIRLIKPGFSYFWLLAVTGALIVWPISLILGFQLPSADAIGGVETGYLIPCLSQFVG